MTRDSARDADGNLPADHPHAYHRRGSEQIDAAGNFVVVCGRTVNYQKTMNSWSDIDCRACLARRQGLSVVPAPQAESAPRWDEQRADHTFVSMHGTHDHNDACTCGAGCRLPYSRHQPDPDAAVRALNRQGVPDLGMITGAQGRCLDCRAVIGAGFDCRLCSAFRLGRDEGARALQALRDSLDDENTEYARGVRDCIGASARRGKEGA